MQHPALLAAFRPAQWNRALAFDIALILTGSVVMIACAYLSFPLPFSPVPVSSQTFGVLLIGALLGSRRGALAQLAYLSQGIAGLPVFAGGKFGLAHLLGPTGGYLIGFVVGAFVIGWLAERGFDQHFKRAVQAMIVADVAIFSVGLAWLAYFVGGDRVLAAGLWPFLPGEIFKIALAATLLPIGWKVLRKF